MKTKILIIVILFVGGCFDCFSYAKKIKDVTRNTTVSTDVIVDNQKNVQCCSGDSLIDQPVQNTPLDENENDTMNHMSEKIIDTSSVTEHETPVLTHVLKNGMTVLVREVHTVPKVSLQLWYNVGSKDEKDGERGLAHLIEHMIFKGTEILSECDIDSIVRKLSGNCNAFTHYDYTGYLFNLPTQNWKQALFIMADCMQNCSFNEQMLNSEMKAVIQELKMNRDHYIRSLISDQIGMIFHDHPYHHPIIGYKQDLWSVTAQNLREFYKKHYLPNNATLVVVGDVKAADVFASVAEHFEHIEPNLEYKKSIHHHATDIGSRGVTLYRDVKQTTLVYTFLLPGLSEKKGHIVSLLSLIIGNGRQSRLYKKLVDEMQIATSVGGSAEELFDHSLLFLVIEPKNMADIDTIKTVVEKELQSIAQSGVSVEELSRAIKQTKMGLYNLFEDIEEQAYEIAKYFIATGDPNYIFNYLSYPRELLHAQVNEMIAQYLRPTVMHSGAVLPLPEQDRAAWEVIQNESDKEDTLILSARPRDLPLQPAMYEKTVTSGEISSFNYPKPTVVITDNGLKILYYNNNNTPKIDILIEFAARTYRDLPEQQGIYNFVTQMMMEGTAMYPGESLMREIEDRGMELSVYPGGLSITLLREDLPYALSIVKEVCAHATFDTKAIEKVRAKILAAIDRFWDKPNSFASQIVNEELYKGHPYAQDILGKRSVIESLTKEDLREFYKKYITPQGSKIAIVGDIGHYNIVKEVEDGLREWKGDALPAFSFPKINAPSKKQIDYYINRDQVVLGFALLSVDRKNSEFDKLYLFDQILSGGVLGASLGSRLFKIREETGLFYTISGSLVAGANEQPGKFWVKTIVSLDRLAEAERVIKETLAKMVPTITEKELNEAKDAIANALVTNFTSNASMASVFLYLDYYNFPSTFFDNRAKDLRAIPLEQVKEAAAKIMRVDDLLTVRIGRIGERAQENAKGVDAACDGTSVESDHDDEAVDE